MEAERARDVLRRGIWSTIRNGHNSAWCRKRLVKPLRRLLTPSENAKDVAQIGIELEIARAEAETSLKRFCDCCTLPHCKLRGAKLTPPP